MTLNRDKILRQTNYAAIYSSFNLPTYLCNTHTRDTPTREADARLWISFRPTRCFYRRVVQTRLLHRNRTGSGRPGQRLVVSARVHRADKLLFDFSDLPVRRTLCSFDLFHSKSFRFAASSVGSSFVSEHSWRTFSCSNWLFGLTGTWKEPPKCSPAPRSLSCSSGVDPSLNTHLSSHLDAFWDPLKVQEFFFSSRCCCSPFKDKKSFRSFCHTSHNNVSSIVIINIVHYIRTIHMQI